MSKSILTYKDGLKDGISIALGYFFVSTGFGITAVNKGIPVLSSVLISLTNLTSAGQVAGIGIIAGCGAIMAAIVEMILTELVINIRYSLMSIGLTQKLDDSFNTGNRLFISFFITDEIYAMSASKKGNISAKYMYGLGTLPIICWTFGTLFGALAASWMPSEIAGIFGIAIYGMFISIVVPPSKKDRGIFICMFISIVLSSLLYYIPFFSFITSGFSIIICSLIAASIAAIVKPVKEDEQE